jgi:hypothetical protein
MLLAYWSDGMSKSMNPAGSRLDDRSGNAQANSIRGAVGLYQHNLKKAEFVGQMEMCDKPRLWSIRLDYLIDTKLKDHTEERNDLYPGVIQLPAHAGR